MRVKMEHVHRITWVRLLLLAPAFLLANAESSTESPNSLFDFDWDISPSMAIITMVLVCAFAFVAFIFFYLRKCARSRVAAAAAAETSLPIDASSSVPQRPRHRGIDRAVIETFPVLTYSAVKGLKIDNGALECAVCLSEFEGHETLRLLPTCNHVFHSDCIDTWLASRVTCPVCRAKIAPAANKLAADSSQSTDSSNDPTQENSESRIGEDEQNHVVVDVEEVERGDLRVVEIVNRPPRTGISEKLPRSHSTGQSPVEPAENTERYRLRLPEEVRKQVLEGGKLEHSTSYGVVLGTVASSRKE